MSSSNSESPTVQTVVVLVAVIVGIAAGLFTIAATGVGPKGEKGEKGDTGIGNDGPIGPSGPSIAVGTIAAWPLPGAPPKGWLICDGSTVHKVDHPELYEQFKKADFPYGQAQGEETFVIPDFRGVFLRGIADPDGNGGREASKHDVDGRNRVVGSFQDYATARPRKTFVTDNEPEFSLVSNGPYNSLVARVGGDRGHGPRCKDHVDDTFGGFLDIAEAHPVKSVPEHSHTIKEGGDSETRPTNFGINWIVYRGNVNPQ